MGQENLHLMVFVNLWERDRGKKRTGNNKKRPEPTIQCNVDV